jgi:hypothetical protein
VIFPSIAAALGRLEKDASGLPVQLVADLFPAVLSLPLLTIDPLQLLNLFGVPLGIDMRIRAEGQDELITEE